MCNLVGENEGSKGIAGLPLKSFQSPALVEDTLADNALVSELLK